MSLAAFRYRNVLAASGGPVERLTCSEIKILGARHFEAGAFLRGDLRDNSRASLLWSAAEGCGTDRSPLVARFKAISEALERWAHQTLQGTDSGAFSLDPSSNGMAAFPGLIGRRARRAAVYEAAERFNILSWWEGLLPLSSHSAPWPGIDAWRIVSDAPGVTVILHLQTVEGIHAFGHAAADTFQGACFKALIELERHERVIRRWTRVAAGRGFPSIGGPDTLSVPEARSLYFSSEAGYSFFQEQVQRSTRPLEVKARPSLLFDGELRGPWSDFAQVWRVVFELPSERFFSNDPRYFLW